MSLIRLIGVLLAATCMAHADCSAPCRALHSETTTSLGGVWKFRGLEARSEPFGPLTDAERALLDPRTDDADWADIAVPLNWWRDPRFSYRKFSAKDMYFCGYYRRRLSVPGPLAGRRILRFEEIGAEADLLVNGRHAGHHLGDFTPFEVDVTDFLHAGENLIALRVLADFGPEDESPQPYTRVYGAHWERSVVKGGLWHNVKLVETPAVRVARLQVDPGEDLMSATVRCRVENHGDPLDAEVEVEIRPVSGTVPVGSGRLSRPVTLGRGATSFEVPVACPRAESWSPAHPALHEAVVTLRRGGAAVAAGTARFGFRTMRIRDGAFFLNGERIRLVGDSIHSSSYGGFPAEDVRKKIRERLLFCKGAGMTLLRTAHMPAVPELYELADELGVLIYDEWGFSFCNHLDLPAFERNNLPALEQWVLRDYNHPSVVLWSLGNEVRHANGEEISRQLDLQYDLVKRLDRQGRPACAFSGVADVNLYGRRRLKTDFLDLHSYLGIDGVPWTRWFGAASETYFGPMTEVYGEHGRLTLPVVMWECVGGGWGVRNDPSVRPGNVDGWLDWMERPARWSRVQENAVCFSPATGLFPLLDPSRGKFHLQTTLGTRLCELFRQDARLAGFAPWFVDPRIPGQDRWNQSVYPLLRRGGGDGERLMFRQLASPDARPLECVVVNDAPAALSDVRVALTVHVPDRADVSLGVVEVGAVPAFGTAIRAFTLRLPEGLPSAGEIRLDLVSAGGHRAWNAYPVTVHAAESLSAPLPAGRPVALAASDAVCERILRDLGVPHAVAPDPRPSADVLVLPPGYATTNGAPLRRFVQAGGTLAVLEPPRGPVAGFSELFVADHANPLVEPVDPAHPLFGGLSPADFDVWAERPCGFVMDRGLILPDRGVLAGVWRSAAVAEYAYGKGRVLVSTLPVGELWTRNPAATRYVRNLVAYLQLPPDKRRAPRCTLTDRGTPGAAPAAAARCLSVPGAPCRVDFPASDQEHHPVKIFFLRDQTARVAQEGFATLVVTLRAFSSGRLDVTLPEKNHRNRLSCVLPLVGDGEPRTYRLDLARDFRFARAGTFPLSGIRGEIILYNGGVERTRGLHRAPLSFEVVDLRFE